MYGKHAFLPRENIFMILSYQSHIKQMEPLVVVGYAVRYPQEAASVEQFWDVLMAARESSTPAPKDRLNSTAFYHPDPNHGGTVRTPTHMFVTKMTRLTIPRH